MEHVLYRKYRPQELSDVRGQEQVVDVLQKSISGGKIAHAYLFAGGRGTGKTSVARILAAMLGVSRNDLHEIDAASNRGIDDIRELRDAVLSLPFESPYKVYIIDEVHMLTKEAFNALLKTLEEPPAHAIFILATTELEKIPDTIVSRCQVFQFKKPNQKTLRQMVLSVAKEEGLKLEPSSADLIALLGDGSFRDTLGVLQKVLSFAVDGTISVEEAEKILGAPSAATVNDIVLALEEKNIEKGLAAVSQASAQNVEMKYFFKLLLQKIRFVLLLRFAPDMAAGIKEALGEEDFELLQTISKNRSGGISAKVLEDLLSASEQVGRTYIPQLPLELALIKILGQ